MAHGRQSKHIRLHGGLALLERVAHARTVRTVGLTRAWCGGHKHNAVRVSSATQPLTHKVKDKQM